MMAGRTEPQGLQAAKSFKTLQSRSTSTSAAFVFQEKLKTVKKTGSTRLAKFRFRLYCCSPPDFSRAVALQLRYMWPDPKTHSDRWLSAQGSQQTLQKICRLGNKSFGLGK